MKRLRQCAASMALLLSLAASHPAWAAPRVALVIPISGEVHLGGKSLSTPRIAEEGQQIDLKDGAEVRIQLLGSSKEKVIKGATRYTISKSALEKEGVSLSRGEVAVNSAEIGNLSRGAMGTSRPVYKPLGVSFTLPPRLEGEFWVADSRTPLDASQVNEKNPVTITVRDQTDPEQAELSVNLDHPVHAISFEAQKLVPGHQYLMHVQRGIGDPYYYRYFRILTPEEEQSLLETEKVLRSAAIASDELPILIRLASLYKSFDQTEKMAQVLLEVVNKPAFQDLDATVQSKLLIALNKARNSLDLENYPESEKKDQTES